LSGFVPSVLRFLKKTRSGWAGAQRRCTALLQSELLFGLHHFEYLKGKYPMGMDEFLHDICNLVVVDMLMKVPQ
jgi:hypothetical protein